MIQKYRIVVETKSHQELLNEERRKHDELVKLEYQKMVKHMVDRHSGDTSEVDCKLLSLEKH